MRIEAGKTYVRKDGEYVNIEGPSKNHPEYAWSRQGDWYEFATGRFVHIASGYHGRPAGQFFTTDRNHRNIVKEAPTNGPR